MNIATSNLMLEIYLEINKIEYKLKLYFYCISRGNISNPLKKILNVDNYLQTGIQLNESRHLVFLYCIKRYLY